MKTCEKCPYPGKCRAVGKCLKQKKDSKKMGKASGNNKQGYGS